MIKDYVIDVLSSIKEFEQIALVEDSEITTLKSEIANLINDEFITTANETGIAKREKLLKIQPFNDDTLSSRRFRINAKWNSSLPYTYIMLIEKLNALVGTDGYILTINNNAYTLNININLGQKRMLQDAEYMVKNMVPANLEVIVELQYNRHIDLAQFTHAELAAYTHKQLREEVL